MAVSGSLYINCKYSCQDLGLDDLQCIYLCDLFNALECHVSQHVGFNAPQEHIIFHLIYLLLFLRTKNRNKLCHIQTMGKLIIK